MEEMICKYCDKEFKREKSFKNHTCRNMERYNEAHEQYARIAYFLWTEFRETNQIKIGDDPYKCFVQSKTYAHYIKFAKYVLDLKCHDIVDFFNFIIRERLQSKLWFDDRIYSRWLLEFLRKEIPVDGVIRSLEFILEYSQKNDIVYTDFFNHIKDHTLADFMRRGKISPWIFLCSPVAKTRLMKLKQNSPKDYLRSYDELVWNVKQKTTDLSDAKYIIKEMGL